MGIRMTINGRKSDDAENNSAKRLQLFSMPTYGKIIRPLL
jgi:hypothetical protein